MTLPQRIALVLNFGWRRNLLMNEAVSLLGAATTTSE